MALSKKQQKWVDVIQWILIIGLLCVVVGSFMYNRHSSASNVAEEYAKDNTYIRIYDSQSMEALRKENETLYDTIKQIRNAETAIEIRYKYKYITDTIHVEKFIKDEVNDSIYHYVQDNDTIRCEFDVKATQLDWMKGGVTIKDKFRIINSEFDGLNQTHIDHSPNVTIDNVDTWHRVDKQKWYQRFHIGPQVGVGYGLWNGKPDVYVGIGVSYDIR